MTMHVYSFRDVTGTETLLATDSEDVARWFRFDVDADPGQDERLTPWMRPVLIRDAVPVMQADAWSRVNLRHVVRITHRMYE